MAWALPYKSVATSRLSLLSPSPSKMKRQQVWEALAGLIASRTWAARWQHFPVVLQVRSNNMGALTLFATLKAGSPSLAIIAREFAIDLGKATCKPALVQHIPGVTNVVCDALSRRYDPRFRFVLPRCLLNAQAILPPPRTHAWWKSLRLSSSSSTPATPLATAEEGRSQSPRCWLVTDPLLQGIWRAGNPRWSLSRSFDRFKSWVL